jgi:predicted nucleotidyltransferase
MIPLIVEHKIKLISVCKELKIKYLYEFGSAVNGKFTNESDLDFLINFEEGISIRVYSDNYFKLHNFLEKLFDRKVDLLTERSIKNPFFRKAIDESKELIYEA